MKKTKKILIIIQRSNGDVFLSSSLVKALYENYDFPDIDLLVNDDTLAIAKLLPHIKCIHTFSYNKKNNNQLSQEINIVKSIYKKYDLSINLTSSDRSVIYARLAAKKAISAIENKNIKSWWKKILLNEFYYFDSSKHILLNNLKSLKILNIRHEHIHHPIVFPKKEISKLKNNLKIDNIDNFIIFHPSAQYSYKVYPKNLRNKLLDYLNTLGVPIIVTGGQTKIDKEIKKEIPDLPNIYILIGKTSLREYFMLSELAQAYIGMDTLNMHIAASQNKKIFAIFGSTNIRMWSPWSNQLKISAQTNKDIQTYGRNTIFQPSQPCQICGEVGCGNNHDSDKFPFIISPEVIFDEVQKWFSSYEL